MSYKISSGCEIEFSGCEVVQAPEQRIAALESRVQALEAENGRLREIARDACGWLVCEGVHHKPSKYHEGDDCPVIEKLRARLRAALEG